MRNPQNSSPSRSDRGSVEVMAAFMAVAMSGLSFAVLQEGFAGKSSLKRDESSLRALEAVEVGLARAESELSSGIDTGGDGIGSLSGSVGGGTYEIVAVPDPLVPKRFLLNAVGRSGLGVRRIDEGVRVVQNGAFIEGLFSHDDLVFNGTNVTDAYDSRLGTYASQAVNTDAHGTYAMLGGSIGSNAGFIDLHGSSIEVRGDAIPGPLHSVNEYGDPVVLGDTTPRKFERTVPPTPFSQFQAAATVNANGTWSNAGGNLTYDAATKALSYKAGGTLTLPAGTYFFSSLSLSGNATLQFTGPSKVYVTGSMDLTGGTLINNGKPSDLLIYAHPYALPVGTTPTSTTVKVNGGSGSKWLMYGPQANLTIAGGSETFGAAVAKSINVSGNNFFHYDKALDDYMLLGPPKVEHLYWREAALPLR